MANVVLLYAECDAERARAISAAAAELRPLLSPIAAAATPMAFGPQIAVMMAWSRAAEAAGLTESFSRIAASHVGPLVVCACDGATLPSALRLRHVMYDLESLRGLDGPAVMQLGRMDQWRANLSAPPLQKAAPVRTGNAFAGGLVRGVAASVAFLGVGGAVALGAVDQLGGPDASPTPASAPDNMRVLQAEDAAAPEIDWGTDEAAPAALDEAELADVANKLSAAEQHLNTMREATAPFVRQLDSWSNQEWRSRPAAPATTPDRVADYSAPLPAEASPVTPASADAEPAAPAAEMASAADALWSPDAPSASSI